ncbi:Regulatory protein leu3 [Paecilomyces lecythidis]
MSSSPPHHKRTRIACKPCRQNKIRCGMRSPPCARCARLEIECIVEPHFRRSNQRDRVRQSENHAQETHQAPMSPSDNTARNVPDEAVPSAGSDKSVMPDLTAPAGGGDAGERQPRGHLDDELPPETRTVYTIGSVTLDAVQADQLLRM